MCPELSEGALVAEAPPHCYSYRMLLSCDCDLAHTACTVKLNRLSAVEGLLWPYQCSVETLQAHWRYWILFFAAATCFHIISAVTGYASWGWWVGMHVCRHRTIAFSFHSKERTTNSVLSLQLFPKGWHTAPQGGTDLEKCQVTWKLHLLQHMCWWWMEYLQ